MHPIEFTWYKILVLITGGIAIGFGITNIVYWNKVREENDCSEISSGLAMMLIWFNIIIVILASILFFWSLFRLLISEEKKQEIKKRFITSYHTPVTTMAGTNINSGVPEATSLSASRQIIGAGTEAEISLAQMYS